MKFRFTAVNPSGKVVTGEEEAAVREELIFSLQGRGLTILDLKESDAPKAVSKVGSGSSLQLFDRITPLSVCFFTRQLSGLMQAGIPLVECLDSLVQFSTSQRFTKVLNAISDDVQRGKGFSEALEAHPQVFPKLYVNILKAGELSGDVRGACARLADYLEKDLEIKGQIRAALTYPTFVLIFSIILVYAMVAWLLPGFEPIWRQSGLDISRYPITSVLMWLGSFTKSFWDELLLFLVVGGLIGLLRAALRTPEATRASHGFLLRLPVLGTFISLTIMSRLTHTLGALVETGMPMVKALELAAGTSGSIHVEEALRSVSTRVQQGVDLSQAFKESPLFPPLMVQMIALGERSGDLRGMLGRVADYYGGQLNRSIKSFSALVEPMTMVLVGGVVFTFVLGVFLPIMGVVGALQQSV